MSNPLGPGQPGSWTRRRFIIDLAFAGGAIVAAAWLAYGNQPSVQTTANRASASPRPPEPRHSPEVVQSHPPRIEQQVPQLSKHNAAGGAPMRLPSEVRIQACGPDPRLKRSTKPKAMD
jgi:hypothetical protein